jgi:hypothetical protein
MNGIKCMCLVVKNIHPGSIEETQSECGFIARELLLPSQEESFLAHGILPKDRQPCLLCCRAQITALYFFYLSKGEEPHEVLQNHYNATRTIDITTTNNEDSEDYYPESA